MNINHLVPKDDSVLILSVRRVSGRLLYSHTIVAHELWGHKSIDKVSELIVGDLLAGEQAALEDSKP